MSSEEHVVHLGVIIIILLIVVVMLINCCHGIHRMKNHSRLAELYEQEVREIVHAPSPTKEQQEKALKYYTYLKNDNWSNLGNMLYEPMAKSMVGKNAEKIMFHTTIGRTSLAAQVQLNTFIQGSMATLLGFRLNSFLNYIVSISDLQGQAEVTVLGLVVVFTVVIIIATSQLNLYIQTKMSSNSIIAEDEVDARLKKEQATTTPNQDDI